MELMRKIRAQYAKRVKIVKMIGGCKLIDLYFVLFVETCGEEGINVPTLWINEVGGFEEITSDQVDRLSDLLKVERFRNPASRKVVGLTPKGIQFLKENVRDLIDDLPAFRLTEDKIKSM